MKGHRLIFTKNDNSEVEDKQLFKQGLEIFKSILKFNCKNLLKYAKILHKNINTLLDEYICQDQPRIEFSIKLCFINSTDDQLDLKILNKLRFSGSQ